jgi:glycosyltransferase involved in cell wall biosynthesis
LTPGANKTVRVAVFSPNRNAPTETFIRSHIEQLPLETVPFYGADWYLSDSRGYVWPVLRYAGAVLGRVAPKVSHSLHAVALSRKLKRLKIDVVLAEYGVTGAGILDACRKAAAPLVVYFYGFDASSRPVIEKHLADYRRIFAYAAAVIAVSSSIKARLSEWGAPPDRTHHMVCGVDPDRFQGASPAQATAHFIAVGRFVEKKAPHLTVLAFREVVAVDPSAKLSMVGDGALLGPTRRLAQALGLDRNVEFLGIRKPEEVSALLRAARAFVQHSLVAEDGDSEGTPVGITEAQMAGLPVVSTFHAGIPEVVEDGVTGFLVPEGDATAMGRMMARLALDAALAERMGRHARERALRLFTLDSHLASLAKLLAEAAGAERRR